MQFNNTKKNRRDEPAGGVQLNCLDYSALINAIRSA